MLISFLLAATLAASANPSAPAPPAPPVHTYALLAIAPAGDQLASTENQQSVTSAEMLHGPVIIRSTRDGHVLKSIDPCAACSYSGLAWSADGKELALLATDGAAGTVQILLAREG